MNVIEKTTTKEQVDQDYKNYDLTAPEGLKEKPWFWNRLGPIFFETPYGSKVLDVGANGGEFLEALKNDRGCEVYGIDVSEVCVDQAKKKGINVILANAHEIPFPDASFDVVYLNEVLIHVFEPVKVLQEVKRVLKPSGILLGSSPHKNLEAQLWEESKLHHEYWDEKGLEAELKKVFDIVFMKVLSGRQFALSMAHSALADEPCELLFKCGGPDTKKWEEALEDKSILRAWMGFTHPPADVYYRLSGFADKMRAKGAEIAYQAYDHNDLDSTSEWQKRIRHKHVQAQFDAIFNCADMSIFQVTGSMDVIAFLRCAKDVYKKPMFTEIDDWLFDVPSYNLASQAYKPNSDAEWCAYEQIKLSDGVIVSTKFLRDQITDLFPEKPVYIVKNSIDFDIWDNIEIHKTIPDKKEGMIRIIYSGCSNHDWDVEIVKKPLLALLEKYKNLEIVWSMQFESWKQIDHPRVIYCNKWLPYTKFPGMLKGWDGDIGIAPLRDNNLNRAKSNLRWLEYSALKLPSVVSKVQPFQECIDGKNGLLANSNKEWFEKLSLLIEDKDLRLKLGETAYQDIKENYNMDKVAEGYMQLLKEIKK
jgi:ubiquinone/menaquinone biosynthesis C-methylase UbiE/glycosyltransferase involved in cell wall biosynthesis